MLITLPTKTTAGGRSLFFILMIVMALFASCSSRQQPEAKAEEEALARTEFTERVENYFEYEPLKAGKQSQFLIHLTDLSDGTPVEKAEVTLVARAKGGGEVIQTKARVGKVTGIYVADVAIPSKGDYDIEFHVTNAKIDERMPLTDFKVE
jgi:5-hydroxyisourate hydrolase-like protein (transthyretin family)